MTNIELIQTHVLFIQYSSSYKEKEKLKKSEISNLWELNPWKIMVYCIPESGQGTVLPRTENLVKL